MAHHEAEVLAEVVPNPTDEASMVRSKSRRPLLTALFGLTEKLWALGRRARGLNR